MPSEAKAWAPFPHDWQSTEYVAGWIAHDMARLPERLPHLQRMLSLAPFAPDAAIDVLDVGAGYGVVTGEVLRAFPRARVTLQDYSQPMLDHARRSLADRAAALTYFVCDLCDPAWPERAGGPFDLAVSAIALHNLGEAAKIFASYRAIRGLLRRGGRFLNYDRFPSGVDRHLAALREAGFGTVECPWAEAPHAITVAEA